MAHPIIPRQRLVDEILSPAMAGTTLVVAPAGYGKSCLLDELARCLRARGIPAFRIRRLGAWTPDGITQMTDGATTDLTSPACLLLDDAEPGDRPGATRPPEAPRPTRYRDERTG